MARHDKSQERILRILGVMLVASLLLAVVSLSIPAREVFAKPPGPQPEGYCDYFWDCWKLVGCNVTEFCPPGTPPCLGAALYKYYYYKYVRYAGACAACPSPCCWRDASGGTMSSCDPNLGNCPAWCPGSP